MDDFNKVYDVFINNKILSLRKYFSNGTNIFKFDLDDWEKIKEINLIANLPSIYILEDSKTNSFYIGETENFSSRLNNHIHNKNKRFDKICVISSNLFNKNIALEIENKTISLFKNSIKNYNVTNSVETNNSFLSAADQLRFNDFWKLQKEIYFLLGFQLIPKEINQNEEKIEGPIFYYKNNKLIVVDGGYLLLKGAKIFTDKNWKTNVGIGKANEIRNDLIVNNKIDQDGILLENCFHIYPSPLATLVMGTSANGYITFKTLEGKTLDEFLERNIN